MTTQNECCGKPCPTPYCPHCGAKMSLPPLAELLEYLRVRQRDAQRRAEERHKKAPSRSGPAPGTWARKWKAWADALEALLPEKE